MLVGDIIKKDGKEYIVIATKEEFGANIIRLLGQKRVEMVREDSFPVIRHIEIPDYLGGKEIVTGKKKISLSDLENNKDVVRLYLLGLLDDKEKNLDAGLYEERK